MLALPDTTRTILLWINSCNDESQLALCRDIIDNFVVTRFKNHITPYELTIAENLLDEAIGRRKTQIIGHGLEILS